LVVPAHNAAATLAETIRSALGAQGLGECIVVDDGSTDGTAAVATRLASELAAAGDPPLRLLSQAQAGPSAARNAGAAAARGDLLAFLDADDRWLAGTPDQRRVGLSRGAAVALGRIQRLAGSPPLPVGEPYEGFHNGSALIRRDAFEALGGFDPGLTHGEELEWFLRARDAGWEISFHSQVVLGYWLHPGSLSARQADRQHGLLSALHHAVRRRSGEDQR
jgi:glycosyltransferase involved in cell wall biosynthesis